VVQDGVNGLRRQEMQPRWRMPCYDSSGSRCVDGWGKPAAPLRSSSSVNLIIQQYLKLYKEHGAIEGIHSCHS
jgi:hypothetical protein